MRKKQNKQKGISRLKPGMPFVDIRLKQRRQNSEVQKHADQYGLQNNDYGNADHEGGVLGLVADDLHRDIHHDGAAQG